MTGRLRNNFIQSRNEKYRWSRTESKAMPAIAGNSGFSSDPWMKPTWNSVGIIVAIDELRGRYLRNFGCGTEVMIKSNFTNILATASPECVTYRPGAKGALATHRAVAQLVLAVDVEAGTRDMAHDAAPR